MNQAFARYDKIWHPTASSSLLCVNYILRDHNKNVNNYVERHEVCDDASQHWTSSCRVSYYRRCNQWPCTSIARPFTAFCSRTCLQLARKPGASCKLTDVSAEQACVHRNWTKSQEKLRYPQKTRLTGVTIIFQEQTSLRKYNWDAAAGCESDIGVNDRLAKRQTSPAMTRYCITEHWLLHSITATAVVCRCSSSSISQATQKLTRS